MKKENKQMILIAGGTASGKTEIAKLLIESFKSNNIDAVYIPIDRKSVV